MWLQGSASRLSPSESCVNTHAHGADRTPRKQIEMISAASPVKHSKRICHPGVVLGPRPRPGQPSASGLSTCFPAKPSSCSPLFRSVPRGQAAGQRWAERPHSPTSGAPAHPAAVPVQGRGFLLLWRPLPTASAGGGAHAVPTRDGPRTRSWQVPSGGQGLRAARVPSVTAEPPARSLARSPEYGRRPSAAQLRGTRTAAALPCSSPIPAGVPSRNRVAGCGLSPPRSWRGRGGRAFPGGRKALRAEARVSREGLA